MADILGSLLGGLGGDSDRSMPSPVRRSWHASTALLRSAPTSGSERRAPTNRSPRRCTSGYASVGCEWPVHLWSTRTSSRLTRWAPGANPA
jgi:hypothetical protein